MAELPPDLRPDARRLSSSRRAAFVLVPLLAVLAVVVLLERSRRSPAEGGLASAGFLPGQLGRPVAPGLERSVDTRLYQPSGGGEEGELSFQDFVDVLGLESAKPGLAPVAAKLKEGFFKDPALGRTYDRFKRAADDGRKPTARAFLATLRSSPQFKKIAAPFIFSPGGSAAFLALAKNPQLKQLMLDEKQALAKAGDAASERSKQAAVGGSPSHRATEQPGGGAGARLATGLGTAPSGEGPSTKSNPYGASVAGGDGPQGSDGHEVKTSLKEDLKKTALKKCDTASAQFTWPWLQHLTKAEIVTIESAVDKYGLWGSCFSQKLYARCAAACNNAGSFSYLNADCKEAAGEKVDCGIIPRGWDACLQFTKKSNVTAEQAEDRCIPLCGEQAGCEVDAAVLRRHCTPPGTGIMPWTPPAFCPPAGQPTAGPSAGPSAGGRWNCPFAPSDGVVAGTMTDPATCQKTTIGTLADGTKTCEVSAWAGCQTCAQNPYQVKCAGSGWKCPFPPAAGLVAGTTTDPVKCQLTTIGTRPDGTKTCEVSTWEGCRPQ